jgi:hypothetical protein
VQKCLKFAKSPLGSANMVAKKKEKKGEIGMMMGCKLDMT